MKRRVKYLFREVDERSQDGQETLLSVSEYYGVKPRSENFGDEEFLSRAETLEGYKKCNAGDLVINIMLAWKRGLGVSPVAGIVSPAYNVFRLRSTKACPQFYHYLFRTDEYLAEFTRRSTGIMASRLRMYPEAFMDVHVDDPPPSIQHQIAAYLDSATSKIDRLIALRRRQMELLREQRAALIQQAVTRGLNPNAPLKDSGLPWLGQIPKHWKLAVLKWQFQIASGDALPTESLLQEPEGVSNIPAIGGNGVMGYTTKSNVSSPRLAVGRVGALCGNVHLVNPPAWITDNALQAYGVRGYELEFLWQLLKVMDLNRLANQNAQPLITGTLVKNQRAPLPPPDEQRAILAHIQRETTKLDGLHRSYERQLALLAEYRASLIHECITGQRPVPA